MPNWTLVDQEGRSVYAPENRYSLSDPATAVLLGGSGLNPSGEYVNEYSAMSLSGVFRAVSLISQGIAALPLKSFVTEPDDQRKRVAGFLDNPAGPDASTPFEWKETVVLHLLLHGNAYLWHRYTDGGVLVGLTPIHPWAVTVEEDQHEPEGKVFWISTVDGRQERVTTREITHIVGPCSDGLTGYSFLTAGRNALGIALAADRSAATLFRNGAQTAGVFTPAAGEDLSQEDADQIRADLDRRLTGADNAGRIPLINRVLEFHPWQMTNADAQWLESRVFQLEEICRFTGVPPYLLMMMEKQSSWGTGLTETKRNFSQFVLLSWCLRISERLTRLYKDPKKFAEFDLAGLEAGSAAEVSALLSSEVNGGMRTLNEARRILNLPAVEGGDELRVPSGVMLISQLLLNAAPPDVPTADPEVEAALTLAKAAPSLVQNPGLPALVDQLKALAGKPAIGTAAPTEIEA